MDISVILFYDIDRGWLDEARQSVLKQKFTGEFELIEISGGSTSENLNAGVRKAKGDFIKPLCEDDELLPGCLQKLYDHIQGYDFICAGAKNYHTKLSKFNYCFSELPSSVMELADYNTIHGGTCMYRKSILESLGGWDESLEFAEEFDLHLRIAASGSRMKAIKELVYFYRIHEYQKSMQGGFTDGELYLKRKRYILHNVQQKYADIRTLINK